MKTIEEHVTDEKSLGYYLALPYPMELHEDDGAYTALYPDLPGCMSYGDTPDEAVSSLKRTQRLWISGRLESGMSVPEPVSVADFSGKLLVRLPKSLHRNLHFRAQQEGVSLNQYITHVLSLKGESHSNSTSLVAAIHAALGMSLVPGIMSKEMYSSHSPRFWNIQSIKPDFGMLDILRHPKNSFTYSQHPLLPAKENYLEAVCE